MKNQKNLHEGKFFGLKKSYFDFSNKKAQGWGMDLAMGSVIFLIGILIFYVYALNSSEQSRGTIENLFYDGKIVVGTILSEGYPENWNPDNVVKIGILTEHKINDTKLGYFYDMALNQYNRTKILLNTKYDYYFLLDENMTINFISIEGVGKPGIKKDNLTADNLIKITRFVVYKDKPITGYLYIWE